LLWLETVKKAGEELAMALLGEEAGADGGDSLKAVLAESQAAELDGYILKEEGGAALRFWFSVEQYLNGEPVAVPLHSEARFAGDEASI
jgi:hypothetical protein